MSPLVKRVLCKQENIVQIPVIHAEGRCGGLCSSPLCCRGEHRRVPELPRQQPAWPRDGPLFTIDLPQKQGGTELKTLL